MKQEAGEEKLSASNLYQYKMLLHNVFLLKTQTLFHTDL